MKKLCSGACWGGVFGAFALPNFIIACKVIGVVVKKFFWGGGQAFVCPRSGVAARVVVGSGGILRRENFEM